MGFSTSKDKKPYELKSYTLDFAVIILVLMSRKAKSFKLDILKKYP